MGRCRQMPWSMTFCFLQNTCTGPLTSAEREERLAQWAQAPSARYSHPREEHLLPLMVAAGAAADDAGQKVFSDNVMNATVSAFRFG